LFALATFRYSFKEGSDDIFHWLDYSLPECSWTTALDWESMGPATADLTPPGLYEDDCWETGSSIEANESDPFDSNCNEDKKFIYMKLHLQPDGRPLVLENSSITELPEIDWQQFLREPS
jgi:hypothetical protein